MFRVIPILLYREGGFYKGRKFKNHVYLGDPQNIIEIFNEKQAHELSVLNITGSTLEPSNYIFECLKSNFLPISFGGSIQSFEYAKFLINLGFDKIIFTSALIKDQGLVRQCVDAFGAQSVIALLNMQAETLCNVLFRRSPLFKGWPSEFTEYHQIADRLSQLGVGEIIIQNPELEGSMNGVNLTAAVEIKRHMSVPVLYTGGICNNADISKVKNAGLDGVLIGSKFVFVGQKRGILISYDGDLTDG